MDDRRSRGAGGAPDLPSRKPTVADACAVKARTHEGGCHVDPAFTPAARAR